MPARGLHRALATAALAALMVPAAAASAQVLPRLQARPAPKIPPAHPAPPRPAPLGPMQLRQALRQQLPASQTASLSPGARLTPAAPWTPEAALELVKADLFAAQADGGYAFIGANGDAVVRFQGRANTTYLLDCSFATGYGGPNQAQYRLSRPGVGVADGQAPVIQGHALMVVPPGRAGQAALGFHPVKFDIGWYFYGCDLSQAG